MTLIRTLLFPLLCTLFITQACANPINRQNAAKHAQAGGHASASGDWDTARRHWAKAVKNGELGNIPEKHQAIFYYEYARAAGITCFFDISETYLKKAYELDKKISGPSFLSLVELFRLNLDQNKYNEAVTNFKKALPLLEEINAPSQSPAEFSKLLDEFAVALQGIGKKDEANKVKERSAEVKENAEHSITDRTPYGSSCTKE